MRKGGSRNSGDLLKLRLALRAAPIGIWDWDLTSNEMDYSPRAREICGFSADQALTLDDVRSVTHPDDLPQTFAQAQRALHPELRDQQPFEYRVIRADTGETRWVIAYGEAVFENVDGRLKAVRYIGTIEDITRRKLAENALREAELRQRLAIDASRVAVWEIELATDRLTVSPELNRMFGLPADAQPSANELRAMFVPEDLKRVTEDRARAVGSGQPLESEFRCRFPDGSTRWRLIRGEVLSGDEDGGSPRLLGLVIDIDEMKRSEERQQLLLREVHHRVKNSLGVVQALATQTFSGERADPEALEAFRGRLHALSAATQLAISAQGEPFRLQELVQALASPYLAEDRVRIRGEDIQLPARLNVPLALTFNELFTNAARFGALSTRQGTVMIDWTVSQPAVELSWIERGGPTVPARLDRNFGLKLILDVLPVEIGAVEVDTNPEGLECRLSIRRV